MNIRFVFFPFLFAVTVFGDLTLWYDEAATKFEEALPIGNGRLGGMVYGTVGKDRISLNESSVWNGAPGNNNKSGAANNLATARQAIFSDNATAACNAVNNMIGGGEASFQPVGNLYINFAGHSAQNYRRELDLKTAIAKTTYTYDGTYYTREYFASFSDQVMVCRLSADQSEKISCTVSLSCPHASNTSGSGNDMLVMDATVDAIKFQTRVKVKCDGGSISISNNSIKINGANSATILCAVGTNFNSYNDISASPSGRAEKYMNDAAARTYEDVLTDHLVSYRELFDRTDINLGDGTNDSTVSTEAQVRRFASSNDPQLVRLYYQFGRYLMISSSRGESQPANLQGVWNESTNPPWGSKYTININTEMNYWMVESANLQECLEPFTRKIKSMVTPGKETAKVHWGTDRGWVAHHNTDLWNRTAPIDGAWGHWPSGGAWLSTHLWEHYLFTLDKEYLEEVYPVIREAAVFYLATLVEEPFSGNKYLGTCPSASPENNPGAWGCDCSFAPTMDIQIIRDILNYTIEASTILNLDPDIRTQAESTVKRLPPNQVGKYGQLQEWFKDWDNPNDEHRHVSHLYGLFPSAQINVRTTPEMADAAETTLEQRGDMATGWSLAWKINLWARLEDGNHAYKLIQLLLTPERTYANLFDAHPPFQIDGNFGAVSGINEMLLQSQNNEIHFLPALPDRWADGSFRGFLARKGFVVDTVEWSGKTLSRAVITSLAGSICSVRYGNGTASFETEAGITYVLDGSLNVTNQYERGKTAAGKDPALRRDRKNTGKTTRRPTVKTVAGSGELRVQLTGKIAEATLAVYSLSGKLLYRIQAGTNTVRCIHVPRMVSGMYLISVTGKNLTWFGRVMIR